MATSISILICTHNRCQLLARTLQSLSQVALPEDSQIDLLVVANACTDDSAAVVVAATQTMPFPVRCVVEPTPGLSIARNRAVQESSGEILAFLDDDVWVEPSWLVELARLYQQYPADFSGGKVTLWWEAVQKPDWFINDYQWILSGLNFSDQIVEMHTEHGAIGANFAVRRQVFARIGGFREDLGRRGKSLLGGEESDLLARTLAAGFRGFYTPHAVVKHWVAPHRVTESYVIGVMAGFTQARIYMKPSFGPRVALRALVGHAWLIVRHQFGVICSRIQGDAAATLRHRIFRAAGKGGLIGSCRRLLGCVPR